MRGVRSCALFGFSFLLLAMGCSDAPVPPKAPQLKASAAAAQAMKLFDANGDGKLDASELKKCPGVLAALARIDTDSDGAVSQAELQARITKLQSSGTIIMDASFQITLDGQPLAAAEVTLEPESFQGEQYKGGKGTSDPQGNVGFVGTADPKYGGFYLGFYRVKISKQEGGKETLPARFNTETEIGYEVAPDAASDGASPIPVLRLKSQQ